ncbi:hypothetical protein PHISCL_01117 [Aspergillus sclerotialis]|uniref:Uncharacterized protein n=1 Tax=Aspergillus sclerotialis TaxID=2070753 RepID=A0A3A3A453_9EURO|nr:hypothetical protein PHISCL_01117 [Aspergillus sclerotialis]
MGSLEINGVGTSLVSKPMDYDEGGRLHRIIQPLFVTLAIRDAFLVLLRRQLSRIRNVSVDNWRNADNPSEIYALPRDMGELGDSDHIFQSSLSSTSQAHVSQDNESSRLPNSALFSSLHNLLLPGLGPGSDIHAASLAFKQRLRNCWAREPPIPRRGVFYITGSIGLRGSKGACRIHVKGEYDPVASEWSTVLMQLSELVPFEQLPAG